MHDRLPGTYDDELGDDRVLDPSLYRLYLGVGSASVALLSVGLHARPPAVARQDVALSRTVTFRKDFRR